MNCRSQSELVCPLRRASEKTILWRFCIPNDKIHFFSYFVNQNRTPIYFHLK